MLETSKARAAVVYVTCALLIAVPLIWTYMVDATEADKFKQKVATEINASIRTAANGERIALGSLGGFVWDYVCFAGYDSFGIDVADGLKVARKQLKDVDFSAYAVANEDYNELSNDWMYGLVFVSVREKRLVAVTFNDVSNAFAASDVCQRGPEASLLVATDESHNVTLTF